VSAWTPVCRVGALEPERAVAALVDGVQVAVVRLLDGRVFCVGHHDPFSGANVIARGIVGSRTVEGEQVPTIASPMFKQVFDVRTGVCLDDPQVSLGSWPVRVVAGVVELGAPTREADRAAVEARAR